MWLCKLVSHFMIPEQVCFYMRVLWACTLMVIFPATSTPGTLFLVIYFLVIVSYWIRVLWNIKCWFLVLMTVRMELFGLLSLKICSRQHLKSNMSCFGIFTLILLFNPVESLLIIKDVYNESPCVKLIF